MRFRSLFGLLLAAALVPVLATPTRAGNVLITVSGTITSTSAGMGYSVGQPVSFFWEINDYAPQTPRGQSSSNLYRWTQETVGSEPKLLADVGGTGIGGTYREGTGDVPWDQVAVETGYPDFVVYMKTDSFDTTTNNRGIFLNADPSYFVSKLVFDGNLAQPYPFPGPFSGLPNPTTFLSDYFGTYAVQSTAEGVLEASAGGAPLFARFAASSVNIAPVAPVPEPSTWAMGAGGLACAAWGAWRRRRRA